MDYCIPERVAVEELLNDIREKVEVFATVFPNSRSLAEALLMGVSDTLDDLVDDGLGAPS